jgi:LmbE family N-acetylglucosaminyl deacetylase
VSPHLDDAVFSCGDLIRAHPGATVVTVFAGGPAAWNAPSPWDAAAGFGPGEDVVAARRREDAAALRALGAHPVWLPFWDSQYGRTPRAAAIRRAVEEALEATGTDAVCLPLGLWHSDHRLTHEATRALPRRHPRLTWLAYADAIYRTFPDGGLRERVAALAGSGLRPRAVGLSRAAPASAAKRRAVARYRSQLRALRAPGHPGAADVYRTERYWWLQHGCP